MAAPPNYTVATFDAEITDAAKTLPDDLGPAADAAAVSSAKDAINKVVGHFRAAATKMKATMGQLDQDINGAVARLAQVRDQVKRAEDELNRQRDMLRGAVTAAQQAETAAQQATANLIARQAAIAAQSTSLEALQQQVDERIADVRRYDQMIANRTSQITTIEETGALVDQVTQLRNELRLEKQARFRAEHGPPLAANDQLKLLEVQSLLAENERLRGEVGLPPARGGAPRIVPYAATIGAAYGKLSGQSAALANTRTVTVENIKTKLAKFRGEFEALHNDFVNAGGADATTANVLAAYDSNHGHRLAAIEEAYQLCNATQAVTLAVATQIDRAQEDLSVNPTDRFDDALRTLVVRRSVSVGDLRSPEHVRLLVSLADQHYTRITKEISALQQTLSNEAGSSSRQRNSNVYGLITAIAMRYGGQQLQTQNGLAMYAFATEADARTFASAIAVSGAVTTLHFMESSTGVELPWVAATHGWARG